MLPGTAKRLHDAQSTGHDHLAVGQEMGQANCEAIKSPGPGPKPKPEQVESLGRRADRREVSTGGDLKLDFGFHLIAKYSFYIFQDITRPHLMCRLVIPKAILLSLPSHLFCIQKSTLEGEKIKHFKRRFIPIFMSENTSK